MSIQTICPNPECGKAFQVAEGIVGRRARCKSCNALFVIQIGKGRLVTLPAGSAGDVNSGQSAKARVTHQVSSSTSSEVNRSEPRLFTTEESVPADWQIGDVLLDLYEVNGVLGEGGFGKVYKIHHKTWNLDLAVKCPRSHLLEKAGAVENFERECETWMNLGLHPHIVSCHYVRRLGGIPRVFAECVEGGNLSSWIRSGKLYEGGPEESLKRILDIAIQFAWGLHYAHEQGLIHQDVKPANVMMLPDGTAKVSDFGLAKARAIAGESASTIQGQSILVSTGGLTPAYCSPEQKSGQSLSRKTDLWSWALSVLEMFTGKVIWRSGTLAQEALDEYLEDGPENANAPQMPAEVAELLQTCFCKDPQVRPPNLFQVAETIIDTYASVTSQPYPRQEFRAVNVLADSLNNRALSFIDLQKPAEAETAWRRALEIDPHHLASVYNLVLHEWRTGRIVDLCPTFETETTVSRKVMGRLREAGISNSQQWKVVLLTAQLELELGHCEDARQILSGLSPEDQARDQVVRFHNLIQERPLTKECLIKSISGHDKSLRSVCFSRDSRYAISGSADGMLKLWDVTSGNCVCTFAGHEDWVASVYLSSDTRHALSGGYDKKIKLWDVTSGQCLRTFDGHGSLVKSVCISSDDRHALSGSSDSTLKLWEIASGQCLRTFQGHSASVRSVCFSSDNSFAISGSEDNTLKLWEVVSGQCLITFKGHGSYVTSVCLSSNGHHVLSGSADRTLKMWDVANGQCLRTFQGHTGTVESVSFSSDGRYALSGSGDNTVKFWNVTTTHCLRSFKEHKKGVNSVCFSIDGRYALSGSGDKKLRIWDTLYRPVAWEYSEVMGATQTSIIESQFQGFVKRSRRALQSGETISALHLLQQARALPGYQSHPEVNLLWQQLYASLPKQKLITGSNKCTLMDKCNVNSVCLSADGRNALSSSLDLKNEVKLWDIPSGKCLRNFEGHKSSVYTVCFSVDGRYTLSGSADYTLKLWDLVSGKCLRTFEGHGGAVRSVCLSADGRYALSGSDDCTLKVWDIASGNILRTIAGHGRPVLSVCLSADGRYVISGSYEKNVKLWDVANAKCLRTFEGHKSSVYTVCFSVDGRYALSGSADDTLKLWDLVSGKCLRTFEGHTCDSACFSLDSRFALSGGRDSTLKLWDVASGQCLRTFEGHQEWVKSVCISGDGRYALSGSSDSLKLWELNWELEDKQPADWDEGARPYLNIFLSQQTPTAAQLSQKRQPSEQEISLALTRRGRPTWTDADFQRLLHTLGCAGFGWLRPEGVKRKLQKMAANWSGPPLLK